MGKSKQEQISIFDFISNDAFPLIDKLGYDFIEANGYATQKARKYQNEREKLSRRLKTGKVELILRHEFEDSGTAVSFWYVLKRRGRVVAVSEKLILKERGSEE
jgi:hypothetical protein